MYYQCRPSTLRCLDVLALQTQGHFLFVSRPDPRVMFFGSVKCLYGIASMVREDNDTKSERMCELNL